MLTHEICDLYPDMDVEDFKSLKSSIQSTGLLNPIVTLAGKILDGKNRLRACKELGITPVFVEFDGNDPLAFVIAQHARRNLTKDQRGIIAATISNMKHGGDRKTQNQSKKIDVDSVTLLQSAEIMGVNRTYVSKAKTVLQERPNAVENIMAGKTTINEVHDSITKEKRMARDAEQHAAAKAHLEKAITGQLQSQAQAEFDARQSAERQRRIDQAIAADQQTVMRFTVQVAALIQQLDEAATRLGHQAVSSILDQSQLQQLIGQMERIAHSLDAPLTI